MSSCSPSDFANLIKSPNAVYLTLSFLHRFNNYDNVPWNLTGCENRCYCENGEVLCQEACFQIEENPPGYLSCTADNAVKVQKQDGRVSRVSSEHDKNDLMSFRFPKRTGPAA